MSAGDQVSKSAVEGNPLSEIEQLRRDISALQSQVMQLGRLDNATTDMGSVTNGELRFRDDNDVVRAILSAENLFDEFGVDGYFAIFDANGVAQIYFGTDGGTFIAEEFPGNAYLRFVTDNDGALVGEVMGTYLPADGGSGLILIGRAKDSSNKGVAILRADDENGNMKAQLLVQTTGAAELDLRGGTGTQGYVVQGENAGTNALQYMMFLDLYTSGAAAPGIGPKFALRTENGSGNIAEAGGIFAKLVDVTNTAEYGISGFQNIIKGVPSPKMFSGIVYAKHLKTDISTSGQTTVFSITVPANWFNATNGGHIYFRVGCRFDTNANARTITPRLIVGGTTVTGVAFSMSPNLTWQTTCEGIISRNTTDVQDVELIHTRDQNGLNTSFARQSDYSTAANDDAAAITVSFTLQLAGSVDTGFFRNVVVYAIDTGNTW